MVRALGSKIIIDSFTCAKGAVAAQEIDLSPFQGQIVRIYLDGDLSLTVNPPADQYWQMAELYVPWQGRDSQENLLPLDLSAVQITTFNLPL